MARNCFRRLLPCVLLPWFLVCGIGSEDPTSNAQRASPATYLSIVMCGRHDDKRGDYAGRLQNSIDFLLFQATKLQARIEIVVVEWNPLPNASRLSALLRVPPDSSSMVRIITVPHSFHQAVMGATQQDFFEFMAKNVGARRARGQFVLFSNGDVLLSDDVMRMFAEERLDSDAFYRIARTELPGLMDPLAPLHLRMEAMDELLAVMGQERTCQQGEKECPGEYNRGVCEAKGQVTEQIARGHLGHTDAGFLPAAGDFFLISRQVLHRIGGYHQVASTTHLDSMLVCKARGMPLRQIVLLRPCAMMHQRHPAPMQPLRFILPGWELTEGKCEDKAEEARAFARGMQGKLREQDWGGGGPSMDPEWGFPSEQFVEQRVGAAGPEDWQWYSTGLFEAGTNAMELVAASRGMRARESEARSELTRRRVLAALAAGREHDMKESGVNRWCAFEPYSRWVADEPTIPFDHWFDMFRSKTCREGVQMTSPVPADQKRERSADLQTRRGGDGVYVSFVVSARHDDLRGDNVGRLQGLIDNVAWGCELHDIACEIVVCEWAPVEWIGGGQVYTSKLRDLLKVPAGAGTAVRVVTVDQSLHAKVAAGSGSSFLEFHAKNVAARRAHGEFVVLTSSDVLLSDAVFDLLGRKTLQRDTYYRMPRVEVPGFLDPLAPLHVRAAVVEAVASELAQGVAVCQNGTRDCAGAYNQGICEGSPESQDHKGMEDPAFISSAGDFLLLSSAALHALGGHHQVPSTTDLAALLVCKARGLPMRQVVLLPPCLVLHQSHPSPVASMRKALPGWEWTEQRCRDKAAEARDFAQPAVMQAVVGGEQTCSGDRRCSAPSMDAGWGWPDEDLPAETLLEEAGEDHWQWWGHSGWKDAAAEQREKRTATQAGEHAEDDLTAEDSDRPIASRTVEQDPREERVVFCVTTTAERIQNMEPALQSVMGQTLRPDAIYLSVAEGVATPDFVMRASQVTVLRHGRDLGPVHKLLDCAQREHDPGTAIITFDDDMVLDSRLAARLVQAADELPEAVVGFSGWNVPGLLARSPPGFSPEDFIGQHSDPGRLPSSVDVLEGYAGVLYRRALVDVQRLSDYSAAPEAARFADDVWISGWLAADGVERVVVALEPERRAPMALDAMFSEIWRQASSQRAALKGHPDRARRNQQVAAHLAEHFQQHRT